jgi:hypothetical protein
MACRPLGGDRAGSAGLEDTLLDHVKGSVEAVFTGLKHQHHVGGDLVASAGQQLCRPTSIVAC